MAQNREAGSQVVPEKQAFQMERAARGQRLSLQQRDADLVEVWAAPGSLSLIGGPEIRSADQSVGVAVWLWQEIEKTGMSEQVRRLCRSTSAPVPPRSLGEPARQTAGWHFPARLRAAGELARQVMAVAVAIAETETDTEETPPPGPMGPITSDEIYVSTWFAETIETAGLSETAAALFHERDRTADARRAALTTHKFANIHRAAVFVGPGENDLERQKRERQQREEDQDWQEEISRTSPLTR